MSRRNCDTMIVLIGASASGKSEIAKMLCTSFHYQKCVTTTTRPKRPKERDGIDYHFVSKEVFQRLQAANAFLEVTEYHHNLYGLQKKDALRHGLVIVDPNGANALLAVLQEEAFIVLIEADEDVRRKRMLARGEPEAQVEERIALDRTVFQRQHLHRIHLVIKNNGDQPLFSICQTIHESYDQHMKHQQEKTLASRQL